MDGDGNLFRGNGFRRVEKISKKSGDFLVRHLKDIESESHSVWGWKRCSVKEVSDA